MFNGRHNKELFEEYGRWLHYITDVFLPIVDSENGDLRSLPFEGGVMRQPYMTMQIVTCIQNEFKKFLSKERERMTSKLKSKRR